MKRKKMIKSFEPIVDKNCKILILGTMPGVMSLKKQQYYGNKENQFWKIIYKLFDQDVENDFETLFKNYPNIKAVFFNGSKAEGLFRKLVAGKTDLKEDLLFYRLPSTSPANAIQFKDKLRQWEVILSYLPAY